MFHTEFTERTEKDSILRVLRVLRVNLSGIAINRPEF